MDDRTRFFLWLLLAGGYFAVLGGVFGAVVGYVTWRDGRAAGTGVGLSVARAFARLGEGRLSALAEGVLVGLVDGLLFGLVVGLALGAGTGWHRSDWGRLGPTMLAGALLVGGAVVLGTMAHVIDGGGRRAVLGLFVGGMIGAGAGFWLAQSGGLLAGILLGAGAGALVARARR